MRGKALELIEQLPTGVVVLPIQTFCELFNVLVRKAKMTDSTRAGSRAELANAYPIAETSATVMI